MATVAVYNIEGKEVDKLELNDNVFGVEINEHLVHLAVVSQLANGRQAVSYTHLEGYRKCQGRRDIYTERQQDHMGCCRK